MKLVNRLIILFSLALATGAHAETVAIATSHPDTAVVLTSKDGIYTSSSGSFNSFDPFGDSRMLVQKKAFNVIYTFGSPTVANRLGVQSGGSWFSDTRGPKAWKIYGSNDYVPTANKKTDDTAAHDAATWIELFSVENETAWVSSETGEYRYYQFHNSSPYTSYKIEVSANNGDNYTQWKYIEYLFEEETSMLVAGNPSEFSDGALPDPAFGHYNYPTTFPALYQSYSEYTSEDETIVARCIGYTFYLQDENGDWVENKSGTECEFTLAEKPDASAKLVWNYANEYLVSVSADICGTVSLSGGYVAHGGTFSVTATPDSGYRFAQWCGGVPAGKENSNPLTLNITAPVAIRALFLPENAAAPVQYVSPDGSDDNNGFTPENARQSISNAVAFVSQFGEIPSLVHVSEGWYPTKKPIRLDGPITISGAGGDLSRTIVSNSVNTGWNTSKNQRVFELNHPEAVVANLTVSGGRGLQVSGANIQFFNGGTVTNCIIENGFGSSWYSQGAAFNIITGRVTRCIIRNCGTDMRGQGAGSTACIGTFNYQKRGDAIVDNCLFIDNYCGSKSEADHIAWVGNGGRMYNCTFVGSRMAVTDAALIADAIQLKVEATGFAANCVAIGATDYEGNQIVLNRPIYWSDAKTISACAVDNITAEDAGTMADILRLIGETDFRDYAAGDYRPTTQSALYDAGTGVDILATTDLLGKNRVVGKAIDIGCYECQTTPGGCILLK